MKPIFVSQEQHDKLKAELHNLKKVERPRIVDAIKEAREHGDLSENAEYTAAKEKQVLVEGKIARLEEMLSRARVLTDEMKIDSVVQIGNRVKVFDMKRNKEYEYELVPTTEFDTFNADAVSIDSPVGKALIGKSVGEIVEIKVPAGVLSYKVVEIS
jgi:transcription elongation factor GreA